MPDDKTTKESDRGFAKKFNEKDILTAAWTLAMDQWVEAGTEGFLDLNKRTTSIEGWIQEATHILEELKEKTKKINRWMDVMDIWTAAASDSIEELEDRVQKLEEYEARYREGRVEERVAALEQIYNKSKQAPTFPIPSSGWAWYYCLYCGQKVEDGHYHPCSAKGQTLYRCPACAEEHESGAFHYCTGKTIRPDGVGQSTMTQSAAPSTAMGCGQRGAAPECGPESAPTPPAGGQTEEAIRRAAQRMRDRWSGVYKG